MVEEPDDQKESAARAGRRTSTQVTNHLANERTFLAWIRTGLATITIGFVVARFGLFLRELGLKSQPVSPLSLHYSALFGVSLTVLGILTIIAALRNFLRVRRDIDCNEFHPMAGSAVALTVIASVIGVLLAIYLFLTS
ncbi:YidH family protein [Dictyobacter aurantiacus]|uniref:DUF202 domain-containing protein n=1 Tax=Dictyobacter aurantiacus TaxID=1936993 RepID=A0A401ZJW9_9CHLR|nr:DUF202 domain-containing protein [Dictyobacter aurantiacus]GCE07139.1 hypothetical protein KDAU_44680 [Dictyobacter aurantiacus]